MRRELYALLLVFDFLGLCFTFILPELSQKVKLTNFNKCKADKEEALTWTYVLNNIDADEWKSIDLDAELHEPITDKFTYSLDVDYFNNGDWANNVFNIGGNTCEMLQRFVSGAWNKVRAAWKLDAPCYIPKGNYTLRNWQVFKDDVNFASMFGKIRTTVKNYNEAGENMICAVGQIEILAY